MDSRWSDENQTETNQKELAKPAVDFWMSLDGGKVAKLGRKDADTLGMKTGPNEKSIPLN